MLLSKSSPLCSVANCGLQSACGRQGVNGSALFSETYCACTHSNGPKMRNWLAQSRNTPSPAKSEKDDIMNKLEKLPMLNEMNEVMLLTVILTPLVD